MSADTTSPRNLGHIWSHDLPDETPFLLYHRSAKNLWDCGKHLPADRIDWVHYTATVNPRAAYEIDQIARRIIRIQWQR